MHRILATTVIHDAQLGERHGAAYLVDLDHQSVNRVIDHRDQEIEWQGSEGGRGLRGVAFHDNDIFIAAGNHLLQYDRRFQAVNSWSNAYLLDPRGLFVHDGTLFVVSSGNDCIIGFDLETHEFRWALHVVSDGKRFKAVTFDPRSNDGPLAINKLRLRSVTVDESGMRFLGLQSGGLLYFNGKTITMSVELPEGSSDAMLLRNGALFTDSRAGALRFADRKNPQMDRVMKTPFFQQQDHQELDDDVTRATKSGYVRGLCLLGENAAAVGTSPAGLIVFDLSNEERLLATTFSQDAKQSINCLALWPDD